MSEPLRNLIARAGGDGDGRCDAHPLGIGGGRAAPRPGRRYASAPIPLINLTPPPAAK